MGTVAALATIFAGLVAARFVVGGSTKILLLLAGMLFLCAGYLYPRLVMWALVIITVCFGETSYGVSDSSAFRLGSYVLDPFLLNVYELLVYPLFAILVVRRLARHPGTALPKSVALPSLGFAFVYILQVVRGLIDGFPYSEVIHRWNGRYILAGIVALWCFTQLLDTPRLRLRLLDGLFALATLRALYALVGYFLGTGDVANAYRTLNVKVAIWESADHILFVLLVVVAIAGWATQRISRYRRILWVTSAVPMALVVVLSFRRTGWLGLLLALVVTVVFLAGRSSRVLVLLPTILAAGAGILTISYRRFARTGSLFSRLFPDLAGTYGTSRQEEWGLAWSTIIKNPVTGDIVARRTANVLYEWDTRIVHNAVLFAWMKFGLLGLLPMGFLVLSCLRYAVRGVLRRCDEEHIALGVVAIVPFVILLAMSECILIELRVVLILGMAASLGMLSGRQSAQRRPAPPSGRRRED